MYNGTIFGVSISQLPYEEQATGYLICHHMLENRILSSAGISLNSPLLAGSVTDAMHLLNTTEATVPHFQSLATVCTHS